MPKLFWNKTDGLRKTEDDTAGKITDAFPDPSQARGKYFASMGGNVATNLNDEQVNIANADPGVKVFRPTAPNTFMQPAAAPAIDPNGNPASPQFVGPPAPAPNVIAPAAPVPKEYTGDLRITDPVEAQTNLQRMAIETATGPRGLTTSQQQIAARTTENQMQRVKRKEFARTYPDWARSKGNSATNLAEYDAAFQQSFKPYMGVSPELDAQIKQTWEKFMPRPVREEWEGVKGKRSESRALTQANEQIMEQYGDQALPDLDNPGTKIMPKVAQFIDGKLSIVDNPIWVAMKQMKMQENAETGRQTRQATQLEAKGKELETKMEEARQKEIREEQRKIGEEARAWDTWEKKQNKKLSDGKINREQMLEDKKDRAEEILKRYPSKNLWIDEDYNVRDSTGNLLSQLVAGMTGQAAPVEAAAPAAAPAQAAPANTYATVEDYKKAGASDPSPVIAGKQYRRVIVEKDGKRFAQLELVK